jgi:hypothetical protein
MILKLLLSMREARLLGESRRTGISGVRCALISSWSWSSPVSQSRCDGLVGAGLVGNFGGARLSLDVEILDWLSEFSKLLPVPEKEGFIEVELRCLRTISGFGWIIPFRCEILFSGAFPLSASGGVQLAPELVSGNLFPSFASRIAMPVTCSERVPSSA